MTSGNFFDFKEQVTRRRPLPAAIGDGAAPAGAPGDPPLSVSQLTARITKAIKSGMPQSVMVKGEVSNFHPNRASGHVYFTMKDAGACVDCVMFKSDADRVKFTPGDGMEPIAGGRVDVFPKKGKYQLYVASLQPVGQGRWNWRSSS